jgi:predicted RNase H-like HicB family nuclease
MLCSFTLEYWLDDGWHVGRLREIPGVFSQGESLKELETNIRDAYLLMLEEKDDNQPLPRHNEIKDSLCNLIRKQLGITPKVQKE